MKTRITFSIFLLLAGLTVGGQILPNFGGERAGLSTLSFLKNDMSPRSLALGGSSVAISGDAYSVYNNPAALTDVENSSYVLSNLMLGAGINQYMLSGTYQLENKISNLAFSINALNSGEMEERTEFQPDGTGRKVFVSNIAVGASYARQFSTLFSAGVTVKYIYEGLADYTNHNAAVDVAFVYKTDYRDLKFAVMVQNFGGNSSLNNDSDIPVVFNRSTGISLDANTVPTVFSLGVSMIPIKRDRQSLMTTIQLNHPNDNAENFRFGLEYELMQLFFARAGYKLSVEGQNLPSFGVGVRARIGGHPLYIDYAANPTNHIGFQNSIGLRFVINNDKR